ncbi:MAG: lytic transglycosylase domain-containing protein [Oligoflexia bacterium]|nr:lytic transglycosylase domain-containing protein [Oligoflexia bacterium]
MATKRKKKLAWLKFWVIAIPSFFTINWCYHAINKPSEVIGLFDSHFYNSPRNTWQNLGSDFKDHSTSIITSDFLAALAQTETQGNPIARTYWQWSFSTNPFKIFAPASSAAGLFQITDGTYAQMKRFCIHNGEVVKDGPWYEIGSCWFNFAYNRLIPSHAIEMTAAYLDYHVTKLIKRYRGAPPNTQQKQELAAIIHLCGPQRGEQFVRNRFQLASIGNCGAHNPHAYVNKLKKLQSGFSNSRNN